MIPDILTQIHGFSRGLVGTSKDFIFLRLPSGAFALGTGPFIRSVDMPSQPSFYINNFAQTYKQGWLRPKKYQETASLSSALKELSWEHPRIHWQPPSHSLFQQAFRTATFYLSTGRIQKLVPVIVQSGHLCHGRVENLVCALETLSEQYHPYGCRFGNTGMLGGSPEPLATIEGDRLTTMALAGTAPSFKAHALTRDKEQREHGCVSAFLSEHLSMLGDTRQLITKPMRLGSITHLLTKFETHLGHRPDPEQILRLLHPTPAVGPSPRTNQSMALATALRNLTGCPSSFGAPLAVHCDGAFHAILTIRQILWKRTQVLLPSGCGIVRGSNVDDEWEELFLKRESVKRFLGLPNSVEETPQALSV